MRLLITGASGKVGSHVRAALAGDTRFRDWNLRALSHNRLVEGPGIEAVRGTLSDAADVAHEMEGVTHVLHLAAVKESPALAMDVGVKGMFHLMEAFRASPTARQFILLGGDCSIGHIFHPYDGPVTEDMRQGEGFLRLCNDEGDGSSPERLLDRPKQVNLAGGANDVKTLADSVGQARQKGQFRDMSG